MTPLICRPPPYERTELTPADNSSAAVPSKTVKREMIDWKGASVGGEIPQWVFSAVNDDIEAFSNLPEFKDKKIFFAKAKGKNLDLLKAWVNNFKMQAEFARSVNNFVTAKFGGKLEGNKDEKESENFLTETVAAFSKTRIAGLTKAKDFWVLTRHIDTKKGVTYEDLYQYFVVYSIRNKDFEKQIDKVLGMVSAETEKKKELKNETRSLILENQIYFLSDEAKAEAEQAKSK